MKRLALQITRRIFLPLLLITFILPIPALAQDFDAGEGLNLPEDTATSDESQTVQAPSAQQPPPASVTASQRTTTSNMSCVAVGNAPAEFKPAVCSQQSQSDTGFIGPIEGTGPTAEYCGVDPTGQVITCYKPGNVFYCQGDARWGSTCSMASAACGPTTMAMILSAFGDTILPPDMDKIFQQRGWRSCGDNPSYMQSAVQTLLPEMGYEYHALGVPLNLTRAQEYLDAGYLIIGSTFGHIFVIDGVNPANNTLSLRDPGRCENKDGVVRPASAPWGGQALYYAYAVKKKPTVR